MISEPVENKHGNLRVMSDARLGKLICLFPSVD